MSSMIRELTLDELEQVTGGTDTCGCDKKDDKCKDDKHKNGNNGYGNGGHDGVPGNSDHQDYTR